jgi:hypothetical protein
MLDNYVASINQALPRTCQIVSWEFDLSVTAELLVDVGGAVRVGDTLAVIAANVEVAG